MPKKKKPAQNIKPTTRRSPRGLNKAQQVELQPIAWHLRIVDKNGRWGWKDINQSTFWDIIFPKIRHFETMTYNEVLGKTHHEIPVYEIINEAQKRLKEIEQDDTDQLVSFHIDGKKILWGIRDQNIFKVLWWDSQHEICPAKKKHT